MDFEPVIGLEIHIQLKTQSKMFCRCSAAVWNQPPNSYTCPVCLGLPGALPVINAEAVRQAILLGLALNCQPQLDSRFDRKNYFYPDLPKGYQISQYQLPLGKNGFLMVGNKKIGITRAHLEEDTGKLIHLGHNTLIDFNRAGIPLMEVVSEPDITSAAEAKAYAQQIQQIVRYLGVSDADIEKGQMRLEPNVSLKPKGSKKLPNYKVEVKNIGSMRSLERAVDYEIERQLAQLKTGRLVTRETRGWDEGKQKTLPQRSKELAHDYRYFPEPDLPPLHFDKQFIAEIRKRLPELPQAKLQRFKKDFGLSDYDAEVLTRDFNLANFFESALGAFLKVMPSSWSAEKSATRVANWIKVEVLAGLNRLNRSINDINLHPAGLAEIIYLVESKKLTPHAGKVVLAKWIEEGAKPESLIALMKTDGEEVGSLEKAVDEVLASHQQAVADYQAGKRQALNFLLGQVIKATGGRVDHQKIQKVLLEKLG